METEIINFLDSPFFGGLATLITGGIAIAVYLCQKQSLLTHRVEG
jgi:hypothetical protein